MPQPLPTQAEKVSGLTKEIQEVRSDLLEHALTANKRLDLLEERARAADAYLVASNSRIDAFSRSNILAQQELTQSINKLSEGMRSARLWGIGLVAIGVFVNIVTLGVIVTMIITNHGR